MQAIVHRQSTNFAFPHQSSIEEMRRNPDKYEMCVFAVDTLLQWRDFLCDKIAHESGPFAVARKCTRYEESTLRVARKSPLVLLKLNESVRRFGLVHACKAACNGTSCEMRDIEGYVYHNEDLLSGGTFYYATKESGYPPRMG